MKKVLPIIIIVLVIFLALIIGGVLLISKIAAPKTALTPDEFISQMESIEYYTSDATSQFSSYDYIEEVVLAVDPTYSYQIEFYSLSTPEYAASFFNNNKSIFESSASSAKSTTNISGSNYSKYSLTSGGKYMVVSRIENTCIYLSVEEEYKDAVQEILDNIGY